MKTTIIRGACTPVGRESVKQYGINPQVHNPPRSSPGASNTMFAGFLSVTLGVCVMAGPRATAALSDDLAHRYSFTTDASDTGAVGGLNGTPQVGVTFASGRAAFDGTSQVDSKITYANNDIAAISAVSGGVSIEFWGRFNWNGDDATVFQMGSGAWGNGLTQWAGNGQHIFAQAVTGGGQKWGGIDNWGLSGLPPLSGNGAGPDVHVTNVFDTSTNSVKLYINGGLYATGSMSGVSLADISTTVFNLGGPAMNGGGGKLKGSLDEFRIFNRALSAAEIYALGVAGPDTIATVANATTGGTTNDWNLTTTWSSAAIPGASTNVTINGSLTNSNIVLGTGFGTSGASLALTITNAGSLAMTGATLGAFSLDTTGGSLTMDATSVLSVAGAVDTATSLANFTASTGATINANGGLTVNSAGTWPSVNIVTNGITVNSGLTFDGSTALNSLKVAGSGNVTVEANGKLVIASAGNSAGNLFLNDNSTLSLEGASASMTVANRPEIDRNGSLLSVTDGTLTMMQGLNMRRSRLVVQGSGTLVTTGGNLEMTGSDGIQGGIYVKNTANINGTGRSLIIGNGWANRENYVVMQNSATANFNEVAVLQEALYCDAHGHGAVLEMLDDAALTISGDMYVTRNSNDNGRSGTFYAYAQVYQQGTVTAGGNLKMCDYVREPSAGNGGGTPIYKVQAAYNLCAGSTLNLGGRILGGSNRNGYGNSFFNFHGGTLVYTGGGNQTDWIKLTGPTPDGGTNSDNNLRVWEGATINTGAQDLTVAQAVLAPTGQGISAISITTPIDLTTTVYSSGNAPWVYIDGGGGSGATAVATLNPATNKINGIIVTNPGNDYSSNPLVELVQPGMGTQTATANVTLSANSAYTGGLTKKGLGTLTLTNTNTYVGDTVVQTGTLSISQAYLANGADVKLTTGAYLNLNTSAATDTIRSLYIDGAQQAAGVWAASAGAGVDHVSTLITGSGKLSVTTGAAGYASWASANSISLIPSDDTNNDGVTNGVAYFMNVTGLATNPAINGTTKKVTWPNGGNIANGQYGTQFVVQTSSDLQTWSDVAVGAVDLTNPSEVSYTLTGASPQFARLKVTPN